MSGFAKALILVMVCIGLRREILGAIIFRPQYMRQLPPPRLALRGIAALKHIHHFNASDNRIVANEGIAPLRRMFVLDERSNQHERVSLARP